MTMPSWVMEAKNGQMPAGFVPPTRPALAAGVGPRICLARPVNFQNPGVSYQSVEPACGQPLREGTGDRMAFEHELVTCELCKQLLADAKNLQGQQSTTSESTVSTVPHAAPQGPGQGPAASVQQPPVQLSRPMGEARGLLEELLDVEKLMAWKAELEGELAAVSVFLDAARARTEKLAS